MTYAELSKKHPGLIFDNFDLTTEDDNLKVGLHYLMEPDIKFTTELIFPNISMERYALLESVFKNIAFNLGVVEMISYWKSACPPEVIIRCGYLSDSQVDFWRKLLINGLGEFFYKNNIDFTLPSFLTIGSEGGSPSGFFTGELGDKDLITVSGGKDSAVTLGLHKGTEREFGCLLVNPTPAGLDNSKIGGCLEPIVIQRNLDQKILELNSIGYLNGHIPISAVISFICLFAQILYGYRYGIISEESSSNEGNVTYLGKNINHQWSKSFEFENLFREYVKKNISDSVNFFSLLRPLKEIQIAAIFSEMTEYHNSFRSCNVGSKTNSWCGRCPKCLFTYLALYPFLGKKTNDIFGKDLLNDEDLKPLLKGLIGQAELKPFECVGTFEENRNLVGLIGDGHPLIEGTQVEKPNFGIYKEWDKQNNLPDFWRNLLKDKMERLKVEVS